MPRFIDDIRAGVRLAMPRLISPEKETLWRNYLPRVIEFVRDPDLMVINADREAAYYFEDNDKEIWDIEEDFPHVEPPCDRFWIEHRMPLLISSKERGDTWCPAPNGRVGMLFVAVLPENAKIEGDLDPAVKWFYWCDLFIDYADASDPDFRYQGPHSATFFAVKGDGSILGPPWMQGFFSDKEKDVATNLMSFFNPGLLAISRMNGEAKL